MIVWLLTVIFSFVCWAYALYLIHTKNFNLIEFFGDNTKGRNKYGDISEKGWFVLGSIIVTAIICLIPIFNMIVGLIMVVGAYAIPSGQRFWAWLNKIGVKREE